MMISFLGRWARNAIVVSFVIVLGNVGLQYSSMSHLLPAANVVQQTTTTTKTTKTPPTTTNGLVLVDYNSSVIVEEKVENEDDDNDEVEEESAELILRGKNGTTHMKSNDQSGAVLEDKKTFSSLHLPDCLRARNDTLPRSMYGKMSFPVINLGFPKMGSSSIHTLFGCAGYESFHWRCPSDNTTTLKRLCAQCIQESIDAQLIPLQMCPHANVYSQIDGEFGGRYRFPQKDLLEDLVGGYPNATFLLTFRTMNSWYQSLSNWGIPRLKDQITRSDESLKNGTLQDFSNFFCEHVRRVRDIVPPDRLVEIDIEDPTTSSRMSDIFDLDEDCWGRTNVNTRLHPDMNTTAWETRSQLSRWHVRGKEMIRGKDGVIRVRSADASTPSAHDRDALIEEITENILQKWKTSKIVPDCLRARNDTVPRSMYGKLTLPVINLGFPKMGSTSIHTFFESAGYESLHWMCPKTNSHDITKTQCAQCIQKSIQAGMLPLELCPRADVYAQIDGSINGMYLFPQIDLLENLIFGYENATFLLTFRRMDAWYQSISGWPPKHNIPYLKERIVVTNSTGGKHLGEGRLQDFTNFFCKHVRRVREIVPANRLVEIDIDDPTTGSRMSEIFRIDERLWGRANVNTKLPGCSKEEEKKEEKGGVDEGEEGKEELVSQLMLEELSTNQIKPMSTL